MNTSRNISFSVFPNPAKDILYLDNIPNNSKLKIFNQTGKCIISDVRKEKNSIDISNLSQGTYIIVITTYNGMIGTRKFVKK